ncbi:MAG TPA: carboxypeptidase-like regulatory domain-containing protein [Bacteroidia bacterium]|nr:carboxypeptidase-like regulatory domain-containing protein [Bacteroidia bacterium]
MKHVRLLLGLLLINCHLHGQLTQILKGRVVDKVTGIGLPGAIVQLKSTPTPQHTVTNNDGNFRFKDVPVGRQSLLVTFTGYKPVPMNGLILTSGKEMVLEIEMEESAVEMQEVEVSAGKDTDVVNTMQAANMKAFSIEETERYAGSRQDPARMAQNFAGIQGTNDTRNDIVIRGNSPAGLLWRLEDIDIPNPNHFAVSGSAGGPQSIINNKYLANSEFYTGAFPANYGNAMGGVFDLRMRNGNNEKHERTFQLGVLGTELSLEGPISRKTGATYLGTYRYSTLDLFNKVNFNLGTDAIPAYQDLGFRFNLPTRKAGVFSFSGIGGTSDINIITSNKTERPTELYGDLNRDQYFKSKMGTLILGHLYPLNSRTVMKTSLALSGQQIAVKHYLVIRADDFVPNDTLPQVLDYVFNEQKNTLAWYLKSKLNTRNSIKAGFFLNQMRVNYYDSVKVTSLYDTLAAQVIKKPFKTRVDARDQFLLIQPYINWVHKFSDLLSLNLGLYAQYLSLNGHYAVEPRASLRYQFAHNQVISFSYGMHSQMQSTYLYFAIPDSQIVNGKAVYNASRSLLNKNMDFSKAQHLVIGYDYFFMKYFKIRTEAYYQYLYNVPVYKGGYYSSVSTLNRGATFNRFFPYYDMQNTGKGYNYGLEFTLEKLFHRHSFFMFSTSLFQSMYLNESTGKWANTDFNGNFMSNLLGGLEYQVGRSKKNSISIGSKITVGGGKRYSPVDIAASNAVMDVVPVDEQVNTLQFKAYNRVDLRISYKINGKLASTEIALDLLNILNTKNVLNYAYSPDPSNYKANPLVLNYQLGFLPLFYVKVDF